MSDERVELAELRARFGVPADRDLPPGRHTMHREDLMNQIATEPRARAMRARRHRHRGRGFAAVAAVAAVAAAAAGVAVTIYPRSHPVASALAPQVSVVPGSAPTATVVLDRMAVAAAGSSALTIGPDQWFYIKEESEYANETTSPWTMQPMTVRQTWYGQQPGQPSMSREDGHDIPMVAAQPAGGGTNPATEVGINHPTYAWVRSLPTNPAKLLQVVYAASVIGGESKSYTAFQAIGRLLNSAVLPPATQAALYRATALIPGVVFVPDATDAAGRHGFGIALTDQWGERHEWIFSKSSYQYLGERDYQVVATAGAKAGTLVGLSAVLARGAANSLGGRPILIP